MQFQPVQPVRAYERIVQQIEDAILRGDLRPGQRLPSERDLVQQFSVSRSSVREALRVLQSNGMVRSRAGDPAGPEVLPFSPATLQKSMTTLARVSELSLAELIQFRMLLDSSANLLAARLRTEEQLAEMDAAMAVMRAATDDYEEFSRADVAFHDAVARASGNRLVQVCNQVVRSVVLTLIEDKIARAADRTAQMAESIAHHAEVLDAVRISDGPAAARLARQTLYDYYAGYVTEQEREFLRTLIDTD
ncbi:FadR family transcriptional regulator [Planosporangium flavigriseum]|nr:FadR/GntR family transcriptional regulator [Planosporangium flavigriseum]NJC66035.1 FadR family transcriptional regulator [Planosporangium flavigriseum]